MEMHGITRQRLHNQRLVASRFTQPEDVVRWNLAVQSQDYAVAKWGIGQRCHDIVDADLDHLFDEGTILRTHVMRPTWHFVLPEDIRWLLALTAPRVQAANAGRYRQLELDASTLARGDDLLASALVGGRYLTRSELATTMEAAGIATVDQRMNFLLMHAELEGVICSGPRRGKQFTYALFDERVPPAPSVDRESALAQLTHRYLQSHGPATPHDLAWWSGLTVTDARRGIDMLGDAVISETVNETTWWFTRLVTNGQLRSPLVHLLPNYDEYYVGFRNHEPTFDPEARTRYMKRELWAAHMVALDGTIIGGWRRTLTAKQAIISLLLPNELAPAVRRSLTVAADEYGRFLGVPVTVE